jgi:uncharacterized protein YqfA (UPF0365 family)
MTGLLFYRTITVILIVIALGVGFIFYLHRRQSFWLRSLMQRSPVNPFRVMGMKMRHVDTGLFMELNVRAADAGMDVKPQELESLITENSADNARRILESAILAHRENIPADMGFLRSHLASGGDVLELINCKILANRSGVQAELEEMAAHELNRGNLRKVIEAMSIASGTGFPLEFREAAAVDRSGRDLMASIRVLVEPKVISTQRVTAMAKDGFQVSARALLTIRTDPELLVGGAGEKTLLVRAEESLAAAICAAESSKDILLSPEKIADLVWTENLDEDTAFGVMSVQLADVGIGENVGASQRLKRTQAEREIVRAELEKKRDEMHIRRLETQTEVYEEEAKIPKAMATAFEKGKINFMDYYRIKKLKDTNPFKEVSLSDRAAEGDDVTES